MVKVTVRPPDRTDKIAAVERIRPAADAFVASLEPVNITWLRSALRSGNTFHSDAAQALLEALDKKPDPTATVVVEMDEATAREFVGNFDAEGRSTVNLDQPGDCYVRRLEILNAIREALAA